MMNCIERNFKNVKPLILYGCWIKIFIVDEKLHRNWNKLKRAWVHSSAVRCISNRFHWTWKLYNSNSSSSSSSIDIYFMDGVWSVFLLSLFQKGRILQKNIHLIAIYYRLLTFQWAFIVILFLLARTFLPNWNIWDYKHFFTFNFSVAQL